MRCLWYICFLAVWPVSAYSLGGDPFFIQHLDNRNGLSNSAVNCTYQDKDNMLWIGTWDGLNMYDGSIFHVFNYGSRNSFSGIENNIIQYITGDGGKNIWISTIEGVSRYEKESGLFRNYFYTHSRRTPVSEQEFKLAADNKGNVYCWTQPSGLTCYDPRADSFRVLPFSRQTGGIARILFDNRDNLWLLCRNGTLEMYDKREGTFKLRQRYTPDSRITDCFYINGLIYYATANGQLIEIDNRLLREHPVLQLPHTIRTISFYKNHYLIAWNTKGFSVYGKDFQASSFLQKEARQMQDMKLTSFTPGTEQILWCGTDGNGIIKIYPKTKPFETIYTPAGGHLSNKAVRAFCEENNNLWVGTKGSGIIRFGNFWDQPAGNASRQYFSYPGELDNNSVYAIEKGRRPFIYIGTDGKGIGIYDLKTKRFLKWTDIAGHENCADFGSVYAIVQDEDSSVWLGTSGYGLIHLNIYREKEHKIAVSFLGQYTFKDNGEGPANDIIYALVNDDHQRLWVACRYGGLSLMNKKDKSFRNFKAFTYEGSLSHNDVLSLYKDSRNRIWIGTSYGLNELEAEDIGKIEPRFRKLTTANGLPNNTIHAITEDNSGQIWVSTNKGLAKIQPGSLEVSHYQETDGLQSNEFSDGAVWKNRNGYLFFGGTYGFNYFLPRQITGNNISPNLLISGLQLGDKTLNENRFLVVKPESSLPPHYTINRKGDFFELELKTISYSNAEKCEYAYSLEGFDRKWFYSGTSGRIIYSNISPGTYTLKVKWSNGEGIWTPELAVFNLTVKQYFWLTWPALVLYALILGTVVYLLYTYRRNKQKMKHQLEIEHIMRKKEEELHQQQLVFFTNITHELQTPLTLIMGSTERSLEKAAELKQQKPYFLSLIHQQASRLAYLVQQLLDFRKAEAGFLKNQPRQLDISGLMTNLAELFIPLCKYQQRHYAIHIKPGITATIDKDKLEKIMFNLLSNAVRHSGRQDEIVLTVDKDTDCRQLEITVANTGARIPSGQLEKLFDKFYAPGMAEGEKFGAGLGLSFTRQLVLLMNGSISACSEDNQISFRVSIPLATGKISAIAENEQPATPRPSYLYQAMTSFTKIQEPLSITISNKFAAIGDLRQEKQDSILIVEDEGGIRYLLKDILKEEYTIYEAENGKDALDLLGNLQPDLIISDIMMPGMNGLELCDIIKNTPSTCHIPFIMLSAKGTMEHQTKGYEAGADAYIPKPFHINHLKVRIRKLLEYRKRLQEVFKTDSLLDYKVEPELIDADKKFISSVADIIEAHLDEPDFNSAQLEKALNLSKMQLYRKLKTLTHLTPGEFIKHIRLKHAAHLLTTTRLTVSEIFYRTGFNNQSYFYREFKKHFFCAPNEYRGK